MVVKCKFRIIDTPGVSIIHVTCYNRGEVISMNTQQLECFATLAKTLNYARTAEQLSMTQPAVSRQIKSLEKGKIATFRYIFISKCNDFSFLTDNYKSAT